MIFDEYLVMLEIRSDMHFTVVIDPPHGTPGSWDDGATLEHSLRYVGLQCVESEAIFFRCVKEDASPFPRHDLLDALGAGLPQAIHLALRVQHIGDIQQRMLPAMDRRHHQGSLP